MKSLSDVSATTMRETTTPILAIIARMAVTELEARAPIGFEATANDCRALITTLAAQSRRVRKG